MDDECIDAWLELPEFRVTDQVIQPHELKLHLERRDTYLVCPRGKGCCERIKDGRARGVRDVPMLDRPVTLRLHVRRFECSDCHHRPWEKRETFGDHGKWTERLDASATGIASRLPMPGTCTALWLVNSYGVSLDV